MFAYGLSGSGKTFTTYGPDDPSLPEAWFLWDEPHDSWGIFPRLAYDLFNMSERTWKLSMKYFQNVVDIVRDLMSPTGEERSYKTGMRKDVDGFMDIVWCIATKLKSWSDLRKTFKKSNARKSISSTQFNHQSTRGHCIMTFEVNKPKEDDDKMRQKGRIYVCDLAGTEPAADIYFASYKKKTHADGSIEHKLVGPHKDQRRTKELQAQGKKINLSLSEMAQFFMKMAQAMKKKKLKPGKSIPGCNSYFLCKYLKDIMLQARTYLFCAIRPEASYLHYTFSTLAFAKNASVIRLNPKKAIAAATPGERRLMKQLEEMKAMMKALQQQNEELRKVSEPVHAGPSPEAIELQKKLEQQNARELELQKREEEANKRAQELHVRVTELEKNDADASNKESVEIAELKAQLEDQQAHAHKLNEELEKQKEANNEILKAAGVETQSIEAKRDLEKMVQQQVLEISLLEVDDDMTDHFEQEQALKQQRNEYLARGIALEELERLSDVPHFVNIDLDPFRDHRFMFFVKLDGSTVFGTQGDVKPFTLQEPEQCVIIGTNGKFAIKQLAGENCHNGKMLKTGVPVPLANFDRVGMGSEVLLFRIPTEIFTDTMEPDPADIVKEVEEANHTDEQRILEQKMIEFEIMQHQELSLSLTEMDDSAKRERKESMGKLAIDLVNKEILHLLPTVKRAEKYCRELNRSMLTFELQMQRGSSSEENSAIPSVQVRVTKKDTKDVILIQSFAFLKAVSTLQDEHTRIKLALENDREYVSPEAHDPICLFMDHTTSYGSAVTFPEYLQYQMDTEHEDIHVPIKSAMAADRSVGKLEVLWTPLAGPYSEVPPNGGAFNDLPSKLLGKPWTYKLEIRKASGLELECSRAYVEYKFFDDIYETLRIEDSSFDIDFQYSYVHHIECVTQEFLDFLDKPLAFHVYTAPRIRVEKGEQPSTSDPVVVRRMTGQVLSRSRAASHVPIAKMKEKALRKHAMNMEKSIVKMEASLANMEKSLSKRDQIIEEQQEKIDGLTLLLKERTSELRKLRGESTTVQNLQTAIAASKTYGGSNSP